MIYNYYCTNCGHELLGIDIVFDLAQMLDLHSGNGEELFIKFSPTDLQELAQRDGQALADGQRVRLKLTLYDLLGYIAQDFKETYNQEAMQSLTYEEFEQVTSMAKLLRSSGLQNADVQTENIKTLVDAIIAKLEFQEKTDPEVSEDDWKQDTMNYNLYFWVEPEYFEGTEWIYTIKYSSEERPANLLPFSYQGRKIRGYCPECNKPVLDGSGKYEHFLVGFLGAQSAGKTSLFVSMINDLPNYFGKLGIELPEVLCDGKYEKVKNAIEFNKKGWAVGKTDAKATIETYNALSKHPRKITSGDVVHIYKRGEEEKSNRIFLFVRKNKDDHEAKEFYFLGEIFAEGDPNPIHMESTNDDAFEILYRLDVPVRSDIYDYIVT